MFFLVEGEAVVSHICQCRLCKIETERVNVYEIIEAENEEEARFFSERQFNPFLIKMEVKITECPTDLYLRYVEGKKDFFDKSVHKVSSGARIPKVFTMQRSTRRGRSRDDHHEGKCQGERPTDQTHH